MARHQLSSSLILEKQRLEASEDSFLQMIQDLEEEGQWRHEKRMVRPASSTVKEVHSLESLQQRKKTLEKENLSRRDPLLARGPTVKWLRDLDGPGGLRGPNGLREGPNGLSVRGE